MFSFKINKLSTTDNILNGKPCDILYTGYINKDISFGDIVYFEPKNVQYKKLVNGIIDQMKVSLVDGDGNEILSNFNPIRPWGGAQRPGWPNSQLPVRNLLSYDAQTW